MPQMIAALAAVVTLGVLIWRVMELQSEVKQLKADVEYLQRRIEYKG